MAISYKNCELIIELPVIGKVNFFPECSNILHDMKK